MDKRSVGECESCVLAIFSAIDDREGAMSGIFEENEWSL